MIDLELLAEQIEQYFHESARQTGVYIRYLNKQSHSSSILSYLFLSDEERGESFLNMLFNPNLSRNPTAAPFTYAQTKTVPFKAILASLKRPFAISLSLEFEVIFYYGELERTAHKFQNPDKKILYFVQLMWAMTHFENKVSNLRCFFV